MSVVQSAITPETVAAAAIEFDAQDRAIIINGPHRTRIDFWPTALMASDLAPREWEEVAAYILALLDREPMKSSPAKSAHRILLGSFAYDLRGYARASGEPIALEVDLRAATSKADERRIRERLADRQAAIERHMDDVALQQAAQHRVSDPSDPVDEEVWTRPSGDWLANAAAERDHDRHHDHATEEETIDPTEPTKPDDDAWLS